MQLAEFFVSAEQISGIGLVLSIHLQDVRVIFFQIVALLITVHADILNATILLDPVLQLNPM
jgi:hypothetical protein